MSLVRRIMRWSRKPSPSGERDSVDADRTGSAWFAGAHAPLRSRHGARFTSNGEFVPLDRQDTRLWSRLMIEEAEDHLRSAAKLKRIGRYQLEAAIQSIHANRAVTGKIDWPEIALLYEGLVKIAPGIGALVGRAVAIAEAGERAAGFAAL